MLAAITAHGVGFASGIYEIINLLWLKTWTNGNLNQWQKNPKPKQQGRLSAAFSKLAMSLKKLFFQILSELWL